MHNILMPNFHPFLTTCKIKFHFQNLGKTSVPLSRRKFHDFKQKVDVLQKKIISCSKL